MSKEEKKEEKKPTKPTEYTVTGEIQENRFIPYKHRFYIEKDRKNINIGSFKEVLNLEVGDKITITAKLVKKAKKS